MPINDPLRSELDLLDQLEPLVVAREEIAVSRIQEPREHVIAAREFFAKLLDVFNRVQTSYRQEAELFWRTRKQQATVLFSSDTYFSGGITASVFRHFREHIEDHTSDPIVVGLVGKERLVDELPNMKFTYFQLPPDWDKAPGVMSALVGRLLQYRRITFLFGRYNNLVHQAPAHVTLGEATSDKQLSEPERYVFEPSLNDIVSIFEQNLIAVFLKQITGENYLAQLGSQITAMERAETEIKNRRRALVWQEQRENQAKRNRKQRELLAGRQLWFK